MGLYADEAVQAVVPNAKPAYDVVVAVTIHAIRVRFELRHSFERAFRRAAFDSRAHSATAAAEELVLKGTGAGLLLLTN